MDKTATVAAFDQARDDFAAAIQAAPEESLTFVKSGDQYALGGLVHHVNWWILHYRRVLDRLLEGGFEPFTAADPEGELEAANQAALAGLPAGEREPTLAQMRAAHAEFVERLEGVAEADWERKAPVLYGKGDPYPTSPADLTGWLKDHYEEHVPHAGELLAEWKKTKS